MKDGTRFMSRSETFTVTRFTPITEESLDAISEWSFVKVKVKSGDKTEAFWVIVSSRDGDMIFGDVNNDLVHTALHGLDDKSPVAFGTDSVLDIYKE